MSARLVPHAMLTAGAYLLGDRWAAGAVLVVLALLAFYAEWRAGAKVMRG